MKPLRTLAAAILGLALTYSAASLEAQEWTRFRGPNGEGVSDCQTIPTTWTEKDFRWRTELPGVGHSSPVLWGEKLFTISGSNDDATRYVFCVDAKKGTVLWERTYKSAPHTKHAFNSYASSTPVCDAERVYVHWTAPQENLLMALDHEGNIVWRQNMGEYLSQHSGGTSPVLYDNLVIISNDQDADESKTGGSRTGKSFLIAYEKETGKEVWRTDRNSAVVAYSTPIIHKTPDGKDELIFNSQAHGITAIDPKTGKVNWELADLFDKRSVSSPFEAGGHIYGSCGAGAGGNYIVAIVPGDKARNIEPRLAYKIDNAATYVPTPVAKDGLVYMISDGGVATCFDAKTGEVHWRQRVGGKYYSSPLWINGAVYCPSREGQCLVFAAGKKYKKLAENSIGEDCHSTPAIAHGTMYVRTFTHILAIGGEK